jgi:hypothetical protein
MDFHSASYQSFLQQAPARLLPYERLRQKVQTFRKFRYLFALTLLIQFLLIFAGSSPEAIATDAITGLINLSLIFLLFVATTPADTLEDTYKNDVLCDQLKSIDPSLKFNSEDRLSPFNFLDSQLYHLPRLNMIEDYDHVEGLFKGRPFSFSIAKASEKTSRTTRRSGQGFDEKTNTFFGLRFFVARAVSLPTLTLLYSDSDGGTAYEAENEAALCQSPRFQFFETKDSGFDQVFHSYSPEPDSALAQLSPDLKRCLQQLRVRLQGPLCVSLNGQNIYVHCSGERNLFSFELNMPIDRNLTDLHLKEFLSRLSVVELLSE